MILGITFCPSSSANLCEIITLVVCIQFNFVPCYSSVTIWHQSIKPSTQMYIEMCDCNYSTYLCVRSQNLLWLIRTYIYIHTYKFFFLIADICLVKILYIALLVVISISLQYNNTVTAYPVRCLPDWNPVIEVTIAICTTDIDTVKIPDTGHTQHLQNWI
jgi:hypothetical protein